MENEPVQLQTGTSITPEHVFLIRSMFLSGISVLASGHSKLPRNKKIYDETLQIEHNNKLQLQESKIICKMVFSIIIYYTMEWSGKKYLPVATSAFC